MKINPILAKPISELFESLSRASVEDQMVNRLIEEAPRLSRNYLSARQKGFAPDLAVSKAINKTLKEDISFGKGAIERIDKRLIENNPCFLAYDGLKGLTDGKLKFEWKSYLPGEVFVAREKKVDPSPSFYDHERLGYFESEVTYPLISDKDVPWMSIIPHEVFTMEGPIANAKGKVATYGLGLGYFTFMASRKEEVEELIVVERDRKTVSLFKKHLLPRFPHPEKIKIVEGDALDEKTLSEVGKVDYVFADLWHNADDALPLYCELLRNEKAGTRYDYWIEDSIIVYFRRCLISYLYEQAVEGYGDDAYEEAESYDDAILCALHEALRKEVINTREDLYKLFDNEICKKICIKLKF
ncbi:MAG: hypothetical protein K6F32_07835 [Bacilli bacterium]|nr:hypothetical protein [Bacilli bacterium]